MRPSKEEEEEEEEGERERETVVPGTTPLLTLSSKVVEADAPVPLLCVPPMSPANLRDQPT